MSDKLDLNDDDFIEKFTLVNKKRSKNYDLIEKNFEKIEQLLSEKYSRNSIAKSIGMSPAVFNRNYAEVRKAKNSTTSQTRGKFETLSPGGLVTKSAKKQRR